MGCLLSTVVVFGLAMELRKERHRSSGGEVRADREVAHPVA